jgi:hypothetical protein
MRVWDRGPQKIAYSGVTAVTLRCMRRSTWGGEMFVFADADSHFGEPEGVHLIRTPCHVGVLSPIVHAIRCSSRTTPPLREAPTSRR